RCLTDLRERYARCEIQAGQPIVPYRETIVGAEEMRPPADKELGRGAVILATTSKQVVIRLRVLPLPSQVIKFLSKNSQSIKRLYSERKAEESTDIENVERHIDQVLETDRSLGSEEVLSLFEFKQQLQAIFEGVKGHRDIWNKVTEQITAFGPRR